MKHIRALWLELLLLCSIPLIYGIVSVRASIPGLNCAVNGIEVLSSNNIPPLCNALGEGDLPGLVRISRDGRFPPLYSIGSASAYLAAGRDWTLMKVIHNTFYLVLLLAGTYLLGSLAGGRATGLIAALLLASHPLILGSFRKFSFDLAMAAVVPASVYFLLKSELFRNRGWSIAFAVSCGAGMMIKDPFAAFLAGPALFTAFAAAKDPEARPRLPGRLALMAAIALVIMAPYYFSARNFGIAAWRPFTESTMSPWFHDAKMLTAGLFVNFLGLQFLPFLALGAYFFARNRMRGVRPVFLLWIALPVLVVLFMPHWKSLRYLLPVLPALVLICAAGLRPLIGAWYGKAFLAAVIVVNAATTAEIVSGKTYGRLTAFLASTYTSNKSSAELIMPAAAEKRNAAILMSIVSAVRKTSAAAGISEPALLVPYSNKSFGLETYTSAWFWLHGMTVTEYNVPTMDAEHFRHAYLDRDAIDFVLCSVQGAPSEYGIPFGAVAASWKHWNLPGTYDEKEYEKMWNGLMAVFNKRTAVYRDELATFYLCSRESVLLPKQPGEKDYDDFIVKNAQHRTFVSAQEMERLVGECRNRAPAPEKSGVRLDRAGLRESFIRALRIGFLLKDRPLIPAQEKTKRERDGYTETEIVMRDPNVGDVPVLLLVPQRRAGKLLPAVIGLHGHTGADVEAREEFRDSLLGRELAKAGFVVAIPLFRVMNFDAAETRVSKKLFMNGFSLMGLRVYETLQTLDLLYQIEYVDPERIGVLGHSGGSVTGYYASMISDRIKSGVYDLLRICEAEKTFHCQTIPELYDLSNAVTTEQLGIPALKVPYRYEDKNVRKKIVQFFKDTLSQK